MCNIAIPERGIMMVKDQSNVKHFHRKLFVGAGESSSLFHQRCSGDAERLNNPTWWERFHHIQYGRGISANFYWQILRQIV